MRDKYLEAKLGNNRDGEESWNNKYNSLIDEGDLDINDEDEDVFLHSKTMIKTSDY